jgi:hypothetical protein
VANSETPPSTLEQRLAAELAGLRAQHEQTLAQIHQLTEQRAQAIDALRRLEGAIILAENLSKPPPAAPPPANPKAQGANP